MTYLLSVTNTLTEIVVAPMNLVEIAMKGGWIMLLLLLLSLIVLYIFIERSCFLRKAGKEDPLFMDKIEDYIRMEQTESALNLCKMTDTPSSRMIEKGIKRMGHPVNEVQNAIENVGNWEISKLEMGLPVMATISSGAPMIGFLGTVIGMVRAFWEMSNAGSNVDITLLSAGIYQAMITTVGGLLVGIIAMFTYNYLVTRVDAVVNKMEAKSMAFIDLLNDSTKK